MNVLENAEKSIHLLSYSILSEHTGSGEEDGADVVMCSTCMETTADNSDQVSNAEFDYAIHVDCNDEKEKSSLVLNIPGGLENVPSSRGPMTRGPSLQ